LGGSAVRPPVKWGRKRTVLVVAIVLVLAIPIWWLASPLFIVTEGTEAPPEDAMTVLATGRFVDGEPGHRNSGDAILLTDGSRYVLRFENFSVTNGPDIHVFLAKGPRYAAGDLDLGSVKATQGSSNYELPPGVDPRAYAYVIIWCVPFSVQFGYATLAFR